MTALDEFECLSSLVTFSSAPYSATVPEHAPLSSKVLEVECEGADQFEEVVVSLCHGCTLLVTELQWRRDSVSKVEVDVRNISDHPIFRNILKSLI